MIRPLAPTDLPELSDLLVRVVDTGASIGFLPPLALADASAYWRDVLTSEDVLTLVASDDHSILGSVQLHLATRPNAAHRAEVARLMVDPDARRQGVGRALMLALELLARERGRTLLVLDTRDGDPSNALYLSLGYQVVGTIPRYARSATGQLDATTFYFKDVV